MEEKLNKILSKISQMQVNLNFLMKEQKLVRKILSAELCEPDRIIYNEMAIGSKGDRIQSEK